MIYVQIALIGWLSKNQATVDKAVFGSEFIAMTHGVETLRGICYTLRTMGVPIDGPNYIFQDNMSVIFKTSIPESKLDKKFNIICYHAIQEAVAMGECMTPHIPTFLDFAYLLTKVLYGSNRRRLVNCILFDIY